MDPNTMLTDLRRLAARVWQASPAELEVRALELAEKVESLDLWLTRGGFLPTAWERA